MDGLDPRIVQDVKSVAQKLGRSELSRTEYLQHGQFSGYQIYDGGQTWEAYCHAAGLATKKNEPVSDEVYLSRLVEAVKRLGRFPKVSERKKFGLNFSKRRYPTLKAFIEHAASLGIVPGSAKEPETSSESREQQVAEPPGAHEGSAGLRSVQVAPIPADTKRKHWERTEIAGFPYAPQDELGVVALFGILCAQGKIEWEIVELRGGRGIDATCYDHKTGKHITVELKKMLSRGSWSHKIDEVDYVVCWENRWPGFPKPVIVLHDLVKLKR
jgi:hypothetical protein